MTIIQPETLSGKGGAKPLGVDGMDFAAIPHVFQTAAPENSFMVVYRANASPYSRALPIYGTAAGAYFGADGLAAGGAASGTLGLYAAIAQNGNKIVIFWIPGNAGAPDATLHTTSLTYNPTTHAFSAPVGTSATLAPSGIIAIALDAVWCPAISRYLVGAWNGAYNTTLDGRHWLGLIPDPVPVGASGPVWSQIPYGRLGQAAGRVVLTGASNGYVVWTLDGWSLLVTPFSATSSAITWGTTEVVPGTTGMESYQTIAVLPDIAGNLDIVYCFSSGGTYALGYVRRTGTNVYTQPATIAVTGLTSREAPALVRDAATGNLYAIYRNGLNNPNGEIYFVVQQGGVWWPTPFLLVQDNPGSYSYWPSALPVSVGGQMYFAFVAYDGTNYFLDFANFPLGGAPNTPTVLSPSGNVGTLTPTFSWIYSNPFTSDAQGGYEIKVMQGATSIWDVTGTGVATSVVYSGPALAWNTAYTVQIRVSDSQANAYSAFSAATTFTPVHPPTVAINSLANAGGGTVSSSPATITARSLTVTLTPTQADSHAMNQWRIDIMDNTGTQLLNSTGWQAASLPSGSAFTTPSFDIGPHPTGSQVQMVVWVQDGTSGLTGSSTWILNASYTAPSAPTGLVVTPNNNTGRLELSWTNAGSPVANRVYLSTDGGTTWQLQNIVDVLTTGMRLYSVPLRTNLKVAVTAVNAAAVESAQTVSGTVQVDLRGTKLMPLLATAAPSTLAAWIGLVDDWQSATSFDLDTGTVMRMTPAGQRVPIESWPVQAAWTSGSTPRKYYLPATQLSGADTTLSASTLTALVQMASSHVPCLYRDIDGMVLYVGVSQFHKETADSIHKLTTFVLTEIQYLVADGGTAGPVREVLGVDY